MKNRDLDRQFKAGMDFLYLARGGGGTKDITDMALQVFNCLSEEKQKELLITLMKEELSRIISEDCSFSMNGISVEIKFHHDLPHEKWKGSYFPYEIYDSSDLKKRPVSVFIEKDRVYIDVTRKMIEDNFTESGLTSRVEYCFFKKVELEISSERSLEGLFLFSIYIWMFSRGSMEKVKVKRTHLLRLYDLYIPTESGFFSIRIERGHVIRPEIDRKFSGFILESYLTQKELEDLSRKKSIVELPSGKKVNPSEFMKRLYSLI